MLRTDIFRLRSRCKRCRAKNPGKQEEFKIKGHVEPYPGRNSRGVTGSMMSVVTDSAKSNAPALGCTGAYAFANVILTLAGTPIMLV